MSYKWRPSKSARREFAQRMQDPQEQAAYEARKQAKADKRRAGSKFDYGSAGGYYVPTKAQFDFCLMNMNLFQTHEEKSAMNFVMSGYTCNEKVHHDFIHIVNEKIRSKI
jgi:hypothetical protein